MSLISDTCLADCTNINPKWVGEEYIHHIQHSNNWFQYDIKHYLIILYKEKKILLWGPSWLYPKQQYQSPYLFHQCWSDLSHCLIRVKFAVKLSWMVSDQNQYFVNSTLTVLINRENVNHGATWWHLCHILPLILCTGLQKKLWTKVTGKL